MVKCLPWRMIVHLTLSFTLACCTRRFSFVEGIKNHRKARVSRAAGRFPLKEMAAPCCRMSNSALLEALISWFQVLQNLPGMPAVATQRQH
jgi:hypothetical protein